MRGTWGPLGGTERKTGHGSRPRPVFPVQLPAHDPRVERDLRVEPHRPPVGPGAKYVSNVSNGCGGYGGSEASSDTSYDA